MLNSLSDFLSLDLPNVSKLGWFGFSADPPTLAHRDIILSALSSEYIDHMIVFPAGRLAYKDFYFSDEERKKMIYLWERSSKFGEKVQISFFDFVRKTAIHWIDLWNMINIISPEIDHKFVIGSDQYSGIIDNWIKGDQVLSICKFLIIPRSGYPISTTNPEHIVIDMEPISGSSTKVRNGNLSFVDDRVRQYITDKKLCNYSRQQTKNKF